MHTLLTQKYLIVTPDFLNVSVSHKIENVSVSHKIVIYRVFLRGADKGVLTMVWDGPDWCQVVYM